MILLETKIFNLLLIMLIIALTASVYMLYKMHVERQRAIKLLEIMIGVLENGNPNLNGHSLHVHNLCLAIYEFLPYYYKLQVKETDLQFASLLLDVGKLAIPDEIMKRSGKLENDEWEIVRKHPEMGIEILKHIQGFSNVNRYILYHHERMDGNGYHQLKGKQIPLGARIIAVADTFSALTMSRSYRPTLSYAEAVSELRASAGTQLDEYLVKVFCSIPMSKIDQCLDDVRTKMERFSENEGGT